MNEFKENLKKIYEDLSSQVKKRIWNEENTTYLYLMNDYLRIINQEETNSAYILLDELTKKYEELRKKCDKGEYFPEEETANFT